MQHIVSAARPQKEKEKENGTLVYDILYNPFFFLGKKKSNPLGLYF
jgi:hypothetical protein